MFTNFNIRIIAAIIFLGTLLPIKAYYTFSNSSLTNSFFTGTRFNQATVELQKQTGNIGLTSSFQKKNFQGQAKNNFDLDSKASELGISKQQLKSLLQNIPSDSLQTDALNSFVLSGQASLDYYGLCVAKAGDVNGDGFDDIIVGSPLNSIPGTYAGRAFLYYGGPYMSDVPAIIFSGEASGDMFGGTVAGAGDLNGDGYSDIIIGAPYNSNKGKVYIYYGGPGINVSYNAAILGSTAGDWFGTSVASAGDVNGDGLADFIVGANGNDAAANNAGAAYLFYGRTNGLYTYNLMFTGTGAGDGFGTMVSSAGDVNGDGYDDVIVAASLNDAGGTDAGRVYCYFGGASMNNIVDVTFTGQAGSDEFGKGISSAGDVNGDGYDDVIIGAPYNDGGATNAGRAYIFYGGSSMDNIADKTITSTYANTNFGYSVAGIGDVNGDAFADVIVGIPQSNRTATAYGAADVYFGGTNMDVYPDILLNGPGANSGFGYSVASAGDLNGDGYFDFIVGAPYNNGYDIGKTFIYKNSLTGNDIADIEFTNGGATITFFGRQAINAGDMNGDGYDDILISAYDNNEGVAFLYLGGAQLNTTADLIFYEHEVGTSLYGETITALGDINGDNFDDVLITDPNYGVSASDSGRCYIYFGGAAVNSVKDVVLKGFKAHSRFGNSAGSAGDVNYDGFKDVIIGCYEDTSHAYIYLGSTSFNSSPSYELHSSVNDDFGISVAGVGDVNGDGYGDVVVGAPNGGSGGRVCFYYGGTYINSAPDLYLNGVGGVGWSVAGAGDVNGDGFPDIMAGAPGYDATNHGGAVYIWYGGYGFDAAYDKLILGHTVLEDFGARCASAGDVNKDGFNDIVVAAPQFYIHDATYGRIYVYFGGADMSTTASVIMTGGPNDFYGDLGISSGDFNNDGYSDIIFGCHDHGNGTAFLHYSSSPAIVPRLISAADVPNDQGGNVRVKFTRSGYDAAGQNKITGYYIEKSPPPGVSGFAWEPVTTISPTHNPVYSFTASSWGDSSASGSDRIYFRITAQTSNGAEYWRSNIVYGQSIDNLSPASPTGLLAAPNSTRINLAWTANNESDLKDYLIYRNGINISSSGTIAFADTTALPDSTYIYKIAARDIHGNISPLSTADTASLEAITTINVTVIPEGLFNTVTNQLRMRDTIKAKLWDLTDSYVIDSAAAVLDSVTFIASFTFKNAPTGNYYIEIYNRNCIETWSKEGGESFTRGTTLSYDFTNSNAKAYGNNLKLKGGRYCLYSGDVNQTGVINSTDRTLIRSNVGQTGYIKYDLDGNGVVNSADRTIVRNNTGIARQRP